MNRDPIRLTHLVTGKQVVIVERTSVSAIFIGDCVTQGSTMPGATWIVLENVTNPIPVKETEEEVLRLLDISITKE